MKVRVTQERLSRGSVEQNSPTPRWSTRPSEYSSPLLRQCRSKSVHQRNVLLPTNETVNSSTLYHYTTLYRTLGETLLFQSYFLEPKSSINSVISIIKYVC